MKREMGGPKVLLTKELVFAGRKRRGGNMDCFASFGDS